MTQTEGMKRIAPGAEVFFGESVVQYLADLSDTAFYEGADAEGLLLGKVMRDDGGDYAVISGATQDMARATDAIGCFFSTEKGCEMAQDRVRRVNSLFGYSKVYVMAVDQSEGAIATYVVENGAARKAPSVMIENF